MHASDKEFQFSLLAFVIDVVALSASLWAGWAFWPTIDPSLGAGAYLLANFLGIMIFSFLAVSENIYKVTLLQKHFLALYTAMKAAIITFSLLLLIAFLLKASAIFSRGWAISWASGFLFYLLISRLLFARLFRRWSLQKGFATPSVIVGFNSHGIRIAEIIDEDCLHQINLVGFIDVNTHTSKALNYSKYPVFEFSDIERILLKYNIQAIFLAASPDDKKTLKDLERLVSRWAVKVYALPESVINILQTSRIAKLGSRNFLMVARAPIDQWSALVKRTEDIVVSSLALLAFSPVLAITALAIKLESPGPVLFLQERYGYNSTLFRVLKFRSMYADQTDYAGSMQATQHDPRVTRVGRIIRRFSIDELPQLLNVIRGDMTLVGPRPHATETKANGRLFQDVVPNYFERHRVKPGLTGWAQVNGFRGATDTEEKILKRVEYDLFYIDNWSIFFDIFILLKTAYIVLFERENAI